MTELLFNRYQKLAKLPTKSQNEVFKVLDTFTGQVLALKLLVNPDYSQDFKIEFQRLKTLNSPNLVKVYDFAFTNEKQLYFTMDFIDGVHFNDFFSKAKKESQNLVLKQITSVLQYLHSQNFIHGDLKTENILVNKSSGFYSVKLIDFGLSNFKFKVRISGTLDYLLPEEIEKKPFAPYEKDFYAFGILLYKSVFGKTPFESKTSSETLSKKINYKSKEIFEKCQNLEEPLKTLIPKLLEREQNKRLKNFEELFQILQGESEIERNKDFHKEKFCGRKKEFEFLKNSFERVYDAIPCSILIEAETGVGKSRLVSEFKSFLQLQETSVFTANCLDNFHGENFFSAGKILAQILFVDEFKNLLSQKRKQIFSQTLNVLAKEKTNENFLKSELFLNFYEFCAEISKQKPIVIILDNIQQEDFGGIELWNYFLSKLKQRKNAKMLLVFTQKKEEISELNKTLCNEILLLEDFSQNEVFEFITFAVGEKIAKEFSQEIFEQTKGNPLLLVEMISFLVQNFGSNFKGDLEKVPKVFDEIFLEKLKKLSEDEIQTLQDLVIFGNAFELSWLERFVKQNKKLMQNIGLLVKKKFLEQEKTRFEFKHQKFREIVYSKIPQKEKAKKHTLIANFFLAEKFIKPEILAFHFSKSENPKLALPFILEAVKNSIHSLAYRNAQKHISEGEVLLAKISQKTKKEEEIEFKILNYYKDTSEFLGYRGLKEKFLRQLELGQKLGEEQTLEALSNLAKYFHKAEINIEESLKFIEQALDFYKNGRKKDVLYVDILLRKIIVVYSRKDANLLEMLTETLEIVSKLENAERLLCSTYNLFAVYYEKEGQSFKAIEFYEKAFQIAVKNKITSEIIVLQTNLADQVAKKISPEMGTQMLENSYLEAKKTGFSFHEFNVGNSLALNLAKVHKFSPFAGLFTELNFALEEIGNKIYEIQLHLSIWHYYFELGYFVKALESIEKLRNEVEKANFHVPISLGIYIFAIGNQAEILLSEGKNEQALEIVSDKKFPNFPFPEILELKELFYGIILFKINQITKAKEIFRKIAKGTNLPLQFAETAKSYLARIENDFESSEKIVISKNFFIHSKTERNRILWNHFLLARETNQSLELQKKILDEAFELVLVSSLTIKSKLDRKNFLLKNLFASKIFSAYFHFHFGENFQNEREKFLEKFCEASSELGKIFANTKQPKQSIEISKIVEISNLLNSSSEPQIILNNLIDLAIEHLKADRGLIILHDKNSGELTVKVGRNVEKETIYDVTQISKTIIKDVSKGGKSIFAFKLDEDERFAQNISVVNLKIRSLVCVPLKKENEIFGTIYLDSLNEQKSFGEYEVEFLETIANLAVVAMENAEIYKKIHQKTLTLQKTVEGKFSFHKIISKDEKMMQIFSELSEVAKTEISVLILGESGTGKELIAKAVHFQSQRKENNFIAIDCGAIPETMIESELFGHKKGSFSGAVSDKKGLLEEANNGTVFLDEITNTSFSFQAKFLRVLQEKEIRRVGENFYRKINVRILAATNLDILEEIKKGNFREDLYFRLNNFSFYLPPLRERKDDIPLLVSHFVEEFSKSYNKKIVGISQKLLDLLTSFEWKGNVRELRSVVSEIILREKGDFLSEESLPKRFSNFVKPHNLTIKITTEKEQLVSLDESQIFYIQKVLQETKGNKSEAARILEIPLSTLRSKMQKLGMKN
ncbi:sigma 54-interacting transcriptional regulator [bacterium]|nr:sigma 54-interacting transcriptional regulator [bacterium]